MNEFNMNNLYLKATEYINNERVDNKYLATPYEALVRGNIFNELYSGYKNYKPRKLSANNEKEKLMLDIRMYGTAMQDLDLYLALHPEDSSIINLRGKYLDMYKDAMEKYQKSYGVLELSSEYTKRSPWAFDENNFPWEVRG